MEWIERPLGPVDAYAIAVSEGYMGTRAQWVEELANNSANAQKSEKFATGKLDGVDVGNTDPAYHNNAYYYSQQASGAASDAIGAKEAAEAAKDAAEAAAAQDVAEWLDEHITNPDSPPLDRSLESSSAAAPADMVGSLKNNVENMKSRVELNELFMDDNDFTGNQGKRNVLRVPYKLDEILDNSMILSNGSIATGSTYSSLFVSPLVPVSEGIYGLKVVHGSYSSGDLYDGNSYDNGFSFFAADGSTVVARPDHLTALGDGIFVIPIPSQATYIRFCGRKAGASLVQDALDYFNQWVLLPNANTSITESFFTLVTPMDNGEIDKLYRTDGSKLEIVDRLARDAIQGADLTDVAAFMKNNNLGSDFTNRLGLPFSMDDVIPFANILSNGTIRDSHSEYDRDYAVTPIIPVTEGTYALYVPAGTGHSGNVKGILSDVNDGYGLFGSDGETPVARVSFTDLGNHIYSIAVPATAKFIRFVFYTGETNSGVFSIQNVESGLNYINRNWVLIKSDSTELTPSDFAKKSDGGINRFIRGDGSTLVFATNDLPNQKILVFGDSIWGNDRADGVADFLHDYTGATVYNCAIGGTRITGDRPDAAWQAFDGVNLIHAKMTDTWTDQDLYKNQVVSYVATETLPLLKSVDMSEISIIILAYGTNDYAANKTIQSVQDALASAITEIWTSFPQIRFLVIAPPWRMFDTTDGDVYRNGNGDSTRAFADGITSKAKAMHITSLDMLTECPWCALTKIYYLDSDFVHPNLEGNKVYAHIVSGKLQSMY